MFTGNYFFTLSFAGRDVKGHMASSLQIQILHDDQTCNIFDVTQNK